MFRELCIKKVLSEKKKKNRVLRECVVIGYMMVILNCLRCNDSLGVKLWGLLVYWIIEIFKRFYCVVVIVSSDG